MPYRIEFVPSAAKELKKVPVEDRRRITEKVNRLSNHPRPPGSKQLENTPALRRIRSGDYRVVYSIDDDILTILVVRIAHRRDAYRNL